MVEPVVAALLFLAAVAGSGLNSVAGGGTFFTFPALLFGGVPPIQANATSAVALWPGSMASGVAYRRDLATARRLLLVTAVASLVGGGAGALLLVNTPQQTFARLVPFLLLAATLLFALGPSLTRRVAQGRAEPAHGGRLLVAGGVQACIAVYGGFFGGGMGFLMLASFALQGLTDIHAMNGLKVVLALCINVVSIATFALAGIVVWDLAAVMVLGSIVGGYGGVRLAKRVDARHVRHFVIVVGALLTAYFFLRPV